VKPAPTLFGNPQSESNLESSSPLKPSAELSDRKTHKLREQVSDGVRIRGWRA